jgi:ferric-dicitrate binding protein FerR (iron transport regulator)
MENDKNIPFHIVKLLVAFFKHTITEAERQELDKWVEASEENEEIFEDCMEMTMRPVRILPDFKLSPEEEKEFHYILELIIKYAQQTITKEERKILDEWAAADPANEELLDVYQWLLNKFSKCQYIFRLN